MFLQFLVEKLLISTLLSMPSVSIRSEWIAISRCNRVQRIDASRTDLFSNNRTVVSPASKNILFYRLRFFFCRCFLSLSFHIGSCTLRSAIRFVKRQRRDRIEDGCDADKKLFVAAKRFREPEGKLGARIDKQRPCSVHQSFRSDRIHV